MSSCTESGENVTTWTMTDRSWPRHRCSVSGEVGFTAMYLTRAGRFPRRASGQTCSITAPFGAKLLLLFARSLAGSSRWPRAASATKRTGELKIARSLSLPREGRSVNAEIAARGRRSSYSSRGRIVNERICYDARLCARWTKAKMCLAGDKSGISYKRQKYACHSRQIRLYRYNGEASSIFTCAVFNYRICVTEQCLDQTNEKSVRSYSCSFITFNGTDETNISTFVHLVQTIRRMTCLTLVEVWKSDD